MIWESDWLIIYPYKEKQQRYVDETCPKVQRWLLFIARWRHIGQLTTCVTDAFATQAPSPFQVKWRLALLAFTTRCGLTGVFTSHIYIYPFLPFKPHKMARAPKLGPSPPGTLNAQNQFHAKNPRPYPPNRPSPTEKTDPVQAHSLNQPPKCLRRSLISRR